jgi:hypothetical protein
MFKKNNSPSKPNKVKSNKIKPYWSKEDYLKKSMSERPLGFYINNFRKQLSLSLFLSFLSLSFVLLSFYVIVQKNNTQKFYLTTVAGEVVEFEMTQKKYDAIQESKKMISERINKQRNQSKVEK